MRNDLEGRVAIVTGASRGIGRATAVVLAAHGARVALASRKREDLDAVAKELAGGPGETLVVPCHMGREEDVRNLVRVVLERWNRVDVLVNNAATSPVSGPFTETSLDVWDKIMAVNLRGPFLLSSLVGRGMKERRSGHIINISSNEALDPSPDLGAYVISKSALISMTKVLARELGPFGVQVNCVAPGLVETKFATPLFRDEQVYRRYIAKTALKRHGQPEEVAELVLFLASAAAAFITGQTIAIDGGETMA